MRKDLKFCTVVDRLSGTSNFDIVADIQSNSKGGENLYYAHNKFSKVQKPNAIGQQRWQCTKANSKKCRAMMSTMELSGQIMMKVLYAVHSHLDQSN